MNNSPKPRIVRTILREEIRKVIIDRILDGTYPPGSRIVESQLAKEFGTSQAPAREALRDLEGMNLIETIPHKGARVRQVKPEILQKVYPVRAALEELAATEAAKKISDDQIEQLENELNAMRQAADDKDSKAQMIHDTRFHEIIVEAADNEVLLDMWHTLRVESGTLISVIRGDWDLHMIAETHAPLLKVMKLHEPELAAKQIRSHIEFYGSMVLADEVEQKSKKRPATE